MLDPVAGDVKGKAPSRDPRLPVAGAAALAPADLGYNS